MNTLKQDADAPDNEQKEGSGKFTINTAVIEKHILEKMKPQDQNALRRVVVAGMKILFSKETHAQIFDNIRPNDQVPLEDELGGGAANIMMMMYKESNQSIPPQVIIPAGAILLAKTSEFIHDTKMAPISDEIYSEALQMFTTVMYDKLDPNFRKRIGGKPAPITPAATPTPTTSTTPTSSASAVPPATAPVQATPGLLGQGA